MFDQQTLHIALLTWGSVFSLISAICMFLSRNFDSKKRIWITSMLVACTLLLASDALAYAYRGGSGTVAYWMVRLSNFFVFFFSDVILFLFHGYVCNCLFSERKDRRTVLTKVMVTAVYVLAVVGCLLVIISQFTGLYYTIDADNFYHRSDYFFISLIPSILGMMIDVFLIVRYRKNLNKVIFISLILYIVLPLTAEIIQVFNYGPSYINIAICISVIIMFATAVLDQSRELVVKEREACELKDSLKVAIDDRERCYSAFAQIYLSMHLVNVKNGSYKTIKSTDNIDSYKDPDNDSFPAQINTAINKLVSEQYKKAVLNFTDISTLSKRFGNRNVVEYDFFSNTSGWCRESFIKVDCDEHGNLWHVLFCIEVIDDEKRRENYLQYLAETDLMTGLTNRGTGEKRVKELLNRKIGGLFCLIDCDKFKTVNDVYGHNVGDKVIIGIAECLKNTCGAKDVVFRLGGDEFAVYSTALSNETQAIEFINRLFESVRNIRIPKLEEEIVSISVGAVFFREGKTSFDQLYRQADFAMYESKKVDGCYATFYKKSASLPLTFPSTNLSEEGNE